MIISKLLSFAKNCSFGQPCKAEIAVYDVMNLALLKATVLKNKKYELIYSRGEKYLFSIEILVKLLTSPLVRKGKILTAYRVALLEIISPKIVLTFCDNTGAFGVLSKYYPSFYLNIQNGLRSLEDVRDSNLPNKYFPAFACFSQGEVDLYNDEKINVGEFFIAGSLKLDYYISRRNDETKEKDFDICLISQYRKILHEFENERKGEFDILHQFLSRYLESYSIRFCIALRGTRGSVLSSQEKNYYENLFRGDISYVYPKEGEEVSLASYLAAERSELTISCSSTLGYEAFALDTRVLIGDFDNQFKDVYFKPSNTFFTLVGDPKEYEIFEKKVSNLLEMPIEQFHELSKQQRFYAMANSKGVSTINVLNALIHKKLSN